MKPIVYEDTALPLYWGGKIRFGENRRNTWGRDNLLLPEILLGAFLKGFNTCGKSENEIRKRFIESQSLQLKLNAVRKVAFHI